MSAILFAFLLLLCTSMQAQQLDWAATMVGGDFIESGGIGVDHAGNTYVAGHFQGTVDFDPGPNTLNLSARGWWDVYVLKLDIHGDLVWAKQIGGDGVDFLSVLVVDSSGHLYLGGNFQDTVDFDPGPNAFPLSTNQTGTQDIFVQKLDANGNFVWAKQMKQISNRQASSGVLDLYVDDHNLYLTGAFHETVDFDPGPSTLLLTANLGADAYIQKLDLNGNLVWAKSIEGENSDGLGIRPDANGMVYVAGVFSLTVDFDPNAGVQSRTALGADDLYILKLDANGNFIWVRTMGNLHSFWAICRVKGLVIDDNGAIYTAGIFSDTMDMDPGIGQANVYPSGSSSCYVHKLDANGNFVWVKTVGGLGSDRGLGITLGDNGLLYAHGIFEQTVDFDPNGGVTNLSAPYSSHNGFLQTLDNNGNFIDVLLLPLDYTSDVFIDQNEALYVTSSYIDTVDLDPTSNVYTVTPSNVEDGYVIKLGPCRSSAGTDVQTACNAFTWIDGNTYTASNNSATFTLTNAMGCDSVVTLDVTINNSSTGVDIQTACNAFTWIDGNTYTASNNRARFILTNVAGCDSIVLLNLTLHTVDTSITSAGNILTANAVGATYQWLACDQGNAPIVGATNRSFTPSTSGRYAARVTQNGCVDTTTCTLVIFTNVEAFGKQTPTIDVYPNPTTGAVVVNLGTSNQALLRVYTIHSQLVQEQTIHGQGQHHLTLEGPAGVYFLQIQVDNQVQFAKLIKQ